jgi:CRP/FNR family transcriptional regulator, cyclic AMP receptor protein
MTTDVAAILRQTVLLRAAPPPDLERVLAASRVRSFRRGQILFTKDDPGDTLLVVISGLVKVVVRSADGGQLTLTHVPPGGIFGELSIADGGSRSADAETLEDSQLLLIPRATIQEICGRVPTAAQALAEAMAASLRRLTDAASDMVFLDLPRRVARVLVSQTPDGDGVIRLKQRQEELANQVGATRQSVNAALRGFQRRGWIQLHERTVIVTHAAALSPFADS